MNRSSLIVIIFALVIWKQIKAENDDVLKSEPTTHEIFLEAESYTVSVKVILDDSTESSVRKSSNEQIENKSDNRISGHDRQKQTTVKNMLSKTSEGDRTEIKRTKSKDISSKSKEKDEKIHSIRIQKESRKPKENFKTENKSLATLSTSNLRNRVHSVSNPDFKEHKLEVDNIENSSRSMGNTNVTANTNITQFEYSTHTSFVNNTRRHGTAKNKPTGNSKSGFADDETITNKFEKNKVGAYMPLTDNKRFHENGDRQVKIQTSVTTSDTDFNKQKHNSHNISYDSTKHDISANENIENILKINVPDVRKNNKIINKPYEASGEEIRKGTEDSLKIDDRSTNIHETTELSKSSINSEEVYKEEEEVIYIEYEDNNFGIVDRTDLKYDENQSDEDYNEKERSGFDDTHHAPFDIYDTDHSVHENRRMLIHPPDIIESKGRTIEETSEANNDFWKIPKEHYHKFIPLDNFSHKRIAVIKPRNYKTYNRFTNVPNFEVASRISLSTGLHQNQPYTSRRRNFNIYGTKNKPDHSDIRSEQAYFDNYKPVKQHFVPYPYVSPISSIPFPIPIPNQFQPQSNYRDVIYKLAEATEHPLIKTNYHFPSKQYMNPSRTVDHDLLNLNLFNNYYNPLKLPTIYG